MTSPTRLGGHINIVGYPTFWDFPFQRSFLAYRLTVWEFPVVSVLVYALLRSRGPLRIPDPLPRSRIDLVDPTTAEPDHWPVSRLLRLVPPAFLVAFAVSSGRVAADARIDTAGLLVGASYAAAVLIISAIIALLARRQSERGQGVDAQSVDAQSVDAQSVDAQSADAQSVDAQSADAQGLTGRLTQGGEALSLVNGFGAVLVSVGALFLVSRHTLVITTSSEVRHWPWFPLGLAGVLLPAVLAWMLWRLARGWAPSRVERRISAVVVGSVAIFLLTAVIPGSIPTFSGFDDAQSVVGADLLTRGYFPWRDFMFIHGMFEDVLRALIGFGVFQHSIWGGLAGTALIVVPLCWVGYYLFAVWASRAGSLIALGVLALAAWGGFPSSPRFVAVPFVFILLGEALRRPRPAWTALFTVAMFVEAVLVPETSFQVVAAVITIVAADIVHRDPERSWWSVLRRTRYFAITGATLSILLAAFLALNHALLPFLSYFPIFGPGHDAAGVIPRTAVTDTAYWMFYVSAALVVLTAWMVAWRLFGRHTWTAQDWITVAAAILTGLYGEKALGRFDGDHVAQTLAVALPLWIIWAVRALGSTDEFLTAQLRRVRALRPAVGRLREPVTVFALAIAVLLVPSVAPAVWNAPGHTKKVVWSASEPPLVGYQYPGAIDPLLLADLRTVLNTYAGSNGAFFDNTNSPGYFHYLLQRAPASTFVHVSMAQPKFAQQLLIDELTKSRPALVAFDEGAFGLPAWDGPRNNVRHFKVGQYLLDGWTPILRSHSVLFMLRNDLVASRPGIPTLASPPQTADLYSSGPACSWGAVGNFLDSPPAGRAVSLPVTSVVDTTRIHVTGWSYDANAGAVPSRVVITIGDSVAAEVPESIYRLDAIDNVKDQSAAFSGFDVSVTTNGQGTLGAYALGKDGALHPIGTSPRPASGAVQMPDGSRLSVTTPMLGSVDVAEHSLAHLLSIPVPASVDLKSFALATFTAPAPIGTSILTLSDEPVQDNTLANTDHEITANVLPMTGSSLPIRVGSCLQWHGYKTKTLYVLQTGGVPITELRLSGVGD